MAPRWSAFRSLPWKLGALVAAAALVVAVADGLLVHRLSRDRMLGDGRSRALTSLAQEVAEARRTGAPPSELITSEGEMPPALAAIGRAGGEGTWYDAHVRNGPRMWAVEPAPGGGLAAVWVDMSANQRDLRALDRNLVGAGALTLAVVLPAGVLVALRLRRRVRFAASTARRIADGDLDARIGPGGRAADEITEMAAAVDTMAAALQRRLRAEQAFTADVAHELRTPLMGLVTSAELLPEGEAAGFVRDRVGVLRALVEDLLEISRLDAGAEHADLASVPVGEVVAESVRRTGLDAAIEVEGAPVAETDPRRLDRIVANLVANAHRHGRPPVEIRVRRDAGGVLVVVRDHGPGLPDDLLAELRATGPRRFRTGTPERGRGHGLGLTIAAGQARVIGARLEFATAPDGGAAVTIHLPNRP
ncbi:sensor histidine kinase [Actinomadura rupiterrae]|uniref:sensor histidine kinase n=1 Tax=Actinomadura rupiterrae TaxID=559627 RepID=UPI0020A5F1C7|nr:HAMP domain-containing sensor histidine kinase [Actinomadura rupiterrae]MCP2342553.1 signal transduction histidine kinase [Actinomadura rupiterrae]